MGSCVSVHKDPQFRLVFGSKTTHHTPSPLQEKPTHRSPPAVTTFPDFGSKDETFFDSQAWLDADCEDDFLSVNGDFTPSCGNTPVHPSLAGNLNSNRDAPASFQQSPPQEKKKRLSELFCESLRSELNEQNVTSAKKETAFTGDQVPPRSSPGASYVSVCNSERTPNGKLLCDVKSSKPAQCCLPRLLSSRSFSERRKRMSPARAVG